MVLGNTFHLFLTPGHELIARARRAAPLPALGPPDHHRLRRLPGVLDGPRHGRRRDQGPRGAVRRGERAGAILAIEEEGVTLPLLPRRLDEVHGPGDLDGGPGRARLGHRARVRRVHAVPRRPRVHGALDRAHAPLARPLPGLARRARARGPGRLRDRPGRRRGGPAARVRAGGRRARRRRDRDRRHARRGQGRRCSRSSSGRSRSCRRAGRATCSASARSTTSCAASSSASTRSTARCRPGSAATAWRVVPDPAKRWRVDLAKARWRDGRRAAARGLPVPGLRARLHAAPTCTTCCAPREQTAHAPAHDPQPRLPAAADGRAARRDRRRPPRRGRRGRARRRGAVGAAA